MGLARGEELHSHGRLAVVEADLGDQHIQAQLDASLFERRPQVGAAGTGTDPVIDVGLMNVNPFLAKAVVIGVQDVPGLLSGREERLKYGKVCLHGADAHRPVRTAVLVRALVVALELLEVGETMRVRPAGQTELCPAVVIARIASNIDHAVQGGGSTDHAPAKMGNRSAVEEGLRSCFEQPGPLLIHERIGLGAGHSDVHRGVGGTGLEHEHRSAAGVLAQSSGYDRAGGAGADHDVVERLVHEEELSRGSCRIRLMSDIIQLISICGKPSVSGVES